MKKFIITAFALISLFAQILLSDIPQKISYQGVLKNTSTGITVPDGTYSMTFSFYSSSTGGTALWSETQSSVVLSGGIFNVELGSVTALPTSIDYNNALYLGIKVSPSTTEMTPRISLNMTPYSYNANAIKGIPVSSTTPNSGDMLIYDGSKWTPSKKPETAVCRWGKFDSYDNATNTWAGYNDASLFGGVTPANWTEYGYSAYQMSSNKEVLRTIAPMKCYAKSNLMLYNENYLQVSYTTGRVVIAIFRIKNTTSSQISWYPSFQYTAYSSFGEVASITVNGSNVWNSPTSGYTTVNLPIPANRTSTVIFVSTSGPAMQVYTNIYERLCRLVFYNNCLQLPSGLEFVDDLDTATGGWEQ